MAGSSTDRWYYLSASEVTLSLFNLVEILYTEIYFLVAKNKYDFYEKYKTFND